MASIPAVAAATLLAFVGALIPPQALAEENPFLTPQERQTSLDLQVQARIDKAMAAMEERLSRMLQDNLGGEAQPARRGLGAQAAALPPPLPGLPPLPNMPTAGDVVPAGAMFIGCLDGKAFFQDRAGSPFLINPAAIPPSAGGAAACAE